MQPVSSFQTMWKRVWRSHLFGSDPHHLLPHIPPVRTSHMIPQSCKASKSCGLILHQERKEQNQSLPQQTILPYHSYQRYLQERRICSDKQANILQIFLNLHLSFIIRYSLWATTFASWPRAIFFFFLNVYFSRAYLKTFNLFLFCGCAHCMWKFPGKGPNPHQSSDLRHSCDNAGSLSPEPQENTLLFNLLKLYFNFSFLLNAVEDIFVATLKK